MAPQDIPYCGDENEQEPVITSDVLTPYTTAAASKVNFEMIDNKYL